MLIVCTGPDSFRARQKYAEMVLGYKLKYDKSGSSIEKIATSADVFNEVLSRLSNQSLFSQKKMIVCEGLVGTLTVAQAKKLEKALVSDADLSIVVDYSDKPLKATIKKVFSEKSLLNYEFDILKGVELNKEVSKLCNKYNLSLSLVPSLIQQFNSDLWSIDTALQVASVVPEIKMQLESDPNSFNIFEFVDAILTNKQWQNQVSQFDANEIIMRLIGQLRQWIMVNNGVNVQIHPYVKSKLQRMKINNPEEEMKKALRNLVGLRSSLVKDDEAYQLM